MEWIRCSDRLPEEYERVLCLVDDEYKINYILNCPDPIWTCTKERDSHKIKYWMPLPKPPEGEWMKSQTKIF